MSEAKKTKVAVLGGGAGALAAAFALSETAERREKFAVTVHQLGFRLGGKAAGGRNSSAGGRIEQSGPHVLLGCYEQTFRLLRECYEELDRPAGAPLARWQDAFTKHGYAVVFCRLSDDSAADEGWFPWTFRFPYNDEPPGIAADGAAPPSLWQLFRLGVEWLWSLWGSSAEVAAFRVRPHVASGASAEHDIPAWIAAAIAQIEALASFEPLGGASAPAGPGIAKNDSPDIRFEPGLGRLVSWIRNVVRSMPEDPAAHDAASHHLLLWLLRRLRSAAWQLVSEFVPAEQWAYKLWVAIDLTASMATGLLSDGILFHGWDSIEHLDFRAWLKSHGAGEITLGSGLLTAVYNMTFAFVNGDPEKGNLAAGTCMNALFRALLTYKGAAIWHLQAGAADTMFAPLYQVLAKRGVKFSFFHRVAGLHLSEDRKQVSSIEIIEQVRLKVDYAPLIEVKGLPCWPSAPLYEQIEDGEALAASGTDLESPYSAPWKDARPLTLRHGEDFDAVVLGISLGAIPYIAAELIMADRAFSSMVANVGTVQSFAFELWHNRDLEELGWQSPSGVDGGPVATAYVAPVGSWADMTHLVAREDWQLPAPPKNIAYFSGALEQLGPNPLFTDQGFPARQRARVQAMARVFLENDAGRLWPVAAKSSGHGFRWEYVLSQYYRANIDPSDRHVLSVAGSAQHRLAPGKSGFDNLVLAGDWAKTSLNLGCIEAAVEAGRRAAEALQ